MILIHNHFKHNHNDRTRALLFDVIFTLETDAESKSPNSRMVSSLPNVVFILVNYQLNITRNLGFRYVINKFYLQDSNDVEDENEQPHNSSSENLGN